MQLSGSKRSGSPSLSAPPATKKPQSSVVVKVWEFVGLLDTIREQLAALEGPVSSQDKRMITQRIMRLRALYRRIMVGVHDSTQQSQRAMKDLEGPFLLLQSNLYKRRYLRKQISQLTGFEARSADCVALNLGQFLAGVLRAVKDLDDPDAMQDAGEQSNESVKQLIDRVLGGDGGGGGGGGGGGAQDALGHPEPSGVADRADSTTPSAPATPATGQDSNDSGEDRKHGDGKAAEQKVATFAGIEVGSSGEVLVQQLAPYRRSRHALRKLCKALDVLDLPLAPTQETADLACTVTRDQADHMNAQFQLSAERVRYEGQRRQSLKEYASWRAERVAALRRLCERRQKHLASLTSSLQQVSSALRPLRTAVGDLTRAQRSVEVRSGGDTTAPTTEQVARVLGVSDHRSSGLFWALVSQRSSHQAPSSTPQTTPHSIPPYINTLPPPPFPQRSGLPTPLFRLLAQLAPVEGQFLPAPQAALELGLLREPAGIRVTVHTHTAATRTVRLGQLVQAWDVASLSMDLRFSQGRVTVGNVVCQTLPQHCARTLSDTELHPRARPVGYLYWAQQESMQNAALQRACDQLDTSRLLANLWYVLGDGGRKRLTLCRDTANAWSPRPSQPPPDQSSSQDGAVYWWVQRMCGLDFVGIGENGTPVRGVGWVPCFSVQEQVSPQQGEAKHTDSDAGTDPTTDFELRLRQTVSHTLPWMKDVSQDQPITALSSSQETQASRHRLGSGTPSGTDLVTAVALALTQSLQSQS